jgi:hypothetical protein
MRRLLAVLVLIVPALVVAPGATAGDTPCVGTVTGMHDNIVVPPGGSCTVSGAIVQGTVKALQDSRVLVTGSNIRGNVEGDKADIVQVVNSTVRENIIIKEGGPAAAPAAGFFFCAGGVTTPCEAVVMQVTVEEGNVQIERMEGDAVVRAVGVLSPIRGNVKLEDNFIPAGQFLTVDFGTNVAQNLQVFKNKGPGSKFVLGNTVRESLQCFENDLPFFGGPNVAREAQGQCVATPLPMAFSTFAAELPAVVN